MKISYILLFSLLLSAGCKKSPTPPYTTEISVGGKTVYVQIVKTQQEMSKGLSGRGPLGSNQGMLFEFENNTTPGFWMKDMKFSLDLIWINDGKIISITPGVNPEPAGTPEKKLPLYRPPEAIDSVLEVSAGWAEKNKVSKGAQVIK